MTGNDPTKENPLRSPLVVLATLACVAGHCALMHSLANKTITLNIALPLHFIPTAVLLPLVVATRKSYVAGWLLLLAVLQASFGALGAVGFLGTLLFRSHFLLDRSHISGLLDVLFGERKFSLAGQVLEEIKSHPEILTDDIDLIPYRDRIRLGDANQKRAILTQIGSHYSAEFAPILKECLKDADAAIRVHAATIMTKVSHKYQDTILKAQREYDANPTDGAQLALAHTYEEYLHSGTSDKQRAKQLQEEALNHYKDYLEKHPEDEENLAAYGRLLLKAGEATKAYITFKEAHKKQATPSNQVWLMETCYRLHRFEEVRDVAVELSRQPRRLEELPIAVTDAVNLWATS